MSAGVDTLSLRAGCVARAGPGMYIQAVRAAVEDAPTHSPRSSGLTGFKGICLAGRTFMISSAANAILGTVYILQEPDTMIPRHVRHISHNSRREDYLTCHPASTACRPSTKADLQSLFLLRRPMNSLERIEAANRGTSTRVLHRGANQPELGEATKLGSSCASAYQDHDSLSIVDELDIIPPRQCRWKKCTSLDAH